jgi:hypothetical protein
MHHLNLKVTMSQALKILVSKQVGYDLPFPGGN